MVQKSHQGVKILAQSKGAVKNTTNNRMEMTAVIKALKALKKVKKPPRRTVVCTDSQYVQKGITEWIHTWKRNSWKTSDKTPVKNQDLWMELDSLAEELSLSWQWVRGHAGNEYNELCDKMTQQAVASLLRN
jgi:ribonuclease HI